MNEKWEVHFGGDKFQLNLSSYSSLFVNYTTSEEKFVEAIVQYFQPRSKSKDELAIKDLYNDYEDVHYKYLQALKLSNESLINEVKLGAKSYLKNQIKTEVLNNIETNGYLNSINVLAEDLTTHTLEGYPVKLNKFTIETFIRMLEFDDGSVTFEGTNTFLNHAQSILPILNKHFQKSIHSQKIIFYMYPELYLSPHEQLKMKELLQIMSKEIPVIVITKSLLFLTDDLTGQNYFIYDHQLFNETLIEDLEWDSPMLFDQDELKENIKMIFKKYVNLFELKPTISNYKQADIILFSSIGLYVVVFLLNRMGFEFTLDLDEEKVDTPVYKYIMEIYENL
ncbi:hypothetical protein [Alkalibacillus haloalkaliphilus]|uniref:hypothetical protein n=1 Tax=Alkalibacillus haloalkaliphilus TaxID=94136 RepID=UPI0002EB84C1|nr:hypothetical protein [Alkalibacillus haloalkaliphilus]